MDRQGFIGGTDAIRIMNGEWAELYQEKVGLVEPKDLTDVFAVQLGAFTEDEAEKPLWQCQYCDRQFLLQPSLII